jgi:hypothetical protein
MAWIALITEPGLASGEMIAMLGRRIRRGWGHASAASS